MVKPVLTVETPKSFTVLVERFELVDGAWLAAAKAESNVLAVAYVPK